MLKAPKKDKLPNLICIISCVKYIYIWMSRIVYIYTHITYIYTHIYTCTYIGLGGLYFFGAFSIEQMSESNRHLTHGNWTGPMICFLRVLERGFVIAPPFLTWFFSMIKLFCYKKWYKYKHPCEIWRLATNSSAFVLVNLCFKNSGSLFGLLATYCFYQKWKAFSLHFCQITMVKSFFFNTILSFSVEGSLWVAYPWELVVCWFIFVFLSPPFLPSKFYKQSISKYCIKQHNRIQKVAVFMGSINLGSVKQK